MSDQTKIRARVLKRDGLWVAVYPSGREVEATRWPYAMRYANKAVYKERLRERLTHDREFALAYAEACRQVWGY
jgi:hypothetical protein